MQTLRSRLHRVGAFRSPHGIPEPTVFMTSFSDAIALQPFRRAGWAGVASGFIGLIAFASLIAFFTYVLNLDAEVETLDDVPLVGRLLLSGHDVGILLQALFMIPVAVVVHTLGRRSSPGISNAAVVAGLIAFVAVVVLESLHILEPGKVSDILFIGPMGLVGLWLIAANWLLKGVVSRGLFTIGSIAGVGLVIAGLSFFLLLDLPALMANPDSYGEDLDFHIGLWIGGVPGLILYAIWTILVCRSWLRERAA